VIHNGKIWLWNDNAPGNEEPPGTKWKDVGDAVAQAGAVAGRVNTLELQVNDPETGLQVIGQKTDGLFAQLDVQAAGDSDWGAGDTTVFAGTLSIQTVIAEGDYALAQRVDTVEASIGDIDLGGIQASVEQVSRAVVDLNGKVIATYTVRAQITSTGQIYMAGMGLGVEQQPDGSYQSQILMQADRFGVINVVNGNITTPFVIQGGQTFISQALIGTAWITNANIADAAITNAKISGVIQSDDYVAEQTGWRINKAAGGGFEFNGSVAGGYRLNITNQGIYIRYPNGNLAVELGVLQ